MRKYQQQIIRSPERWRKRLAEKLVRHHSSSRVSPFLNSSKVFNFERARWLNWAISFSERIRTSSSWVRNFRIQSGRSSFPLFTVRKLRKSREQEELKKSFSLETERIIMLKSLKREILRSGETAKGKRSANRHLPSLVHADRVENAGCVL